MIHHEQVHKYEGTIQDLATEIGDLRYDVLADFLKLLSQKIALDAAKDRGRGRVKLATSLENCAVLLEKGGIEIDEAWRISEPFMK